MLDTGFWILDDGTGIPACGRESSIKHRVSGIKYQIMFVFLSQYKSVVIFVCLCIASLILSWTVGESYNDPIKGKLSVFFAPIHFCASGISSISARLAYVGSIFTSIFQKPAEKSQLQNLETKVENLEILLAQEEDRNRRLEELFEVYDSLTGESSSEQPVTFSLIPAKVIAVDPTNWFRALTIDKGKNDGVDLDMAVITRPDSAIDVPYLTGAVVGKITSVHNRSARVQLITDRLSVVAVTIESLEDLVLLRGQPETENCVIDEIPSTTHDVLKEGNAVIVDERSSIFPPGMLVGHISSIRKGIHFCRIEVQPAFKFRKLREVMVVLDN